MYRTHRLKGIRTDIIRLFRVWLVTSVFNSILQIFRSYHLNIDSDKCSGSLQLLIITTTNLAKNFVEVYITPKDNNGTVIGQITEKEHLPNVSNDINSENIKTKVVAKLYQISDDVIHCNVDQIQADDLNNFIDAVK